MVSSKGPEAVAEEEPLLVEDKIMFNAVERCVASRQTELHTYALMSMRGFCDLVETAILQPSWNTDQGVNHICEFAGVKPIGEMKVNIRCQGAIQQHQPPLIFCETRE